MAKDVAECLQRVEPQPIIAGSYIADGDSWHYCDKPDIDRLAGRSPIWKTIKCPFGEDGTLTQLDGVWFWKRVGLPPTIDTLRAALDAVTAERDRLKRVADKIAWVRDGVGPDVPVLQERWDRVVAERDMAIAHDRQRYPTAAAYEAVCAALQSTKEERDAWHHVVTDCERILGMVGTADSGLTSNLPNFVRDKLIENARLRAIIEKVRAAL